MPVTIEVTATVPNSTDITAQIFEDVDSDGAAENQAEAPIFDGTTTIGFSDLSGGSGNEYWIQFDLATSDGSISPSVDSAEVVDTEPSAITSSNYTTTLNGEAVDVLVFQDTDGDGTPENVCSFTASDGQNKQDLHGLSYDTSTDYWARFDLATGDTSTTPEVDLFEITQTVNFINAQAAVAAVSGEDPGFSAGGISLNPDPASASLAGVDAAVAASPFKIQADAATRQAQPQDAGVIPGEAPIDTDPAPLILTIDSADADRVFDSTTLSGTVTLNGSGVGGATIYCIDDTNGSIAERTTTDQNGDYRVRVDTGDVYHMVVQYEESGDKYNDESKPFLAT